MQVTEPTTLFSARTEAELKHLPLSELSPHPQNPRVAFDEGVISQIAAEITRQGFFSEEHAILCRPHDDGYQIVSGHHRWKAAQRAGLDSIPAWVRPMDDEEALMLLRLENTQSELTPLEEGMHILSVVGMPTEHGGKGNKGGLRAYCRDGGFERSTEVKKYDAAVVVSKVVPRGTTLNTLHEKVRHLFTIYSAPADMWPALVEALVEKDWSVRDTKRNVDLAKSTWAARPAWLDALSEEHLAALVANEPSKTRSLQKAFETAASLHARLSPETIYVHPETSDETEERDGREYYVLQPEEKEYDAPAEFIRRVNELEEITRPGVEEAYEACLQHINEHKNDAPAYRPVLTEDEWEEERERENEIARMQRRREFMPDLRAGKALSLLQGLGASTVDLVATDPPYNIGKTEWDDLGSPQEYVDWFLPHAEEVHRVLKTTGALYLFGVDRQLAYLYPALVDVGFKYRSWITWDTIQGAGGGLWTNRKESILYLSKGDPYEDPGAVKLERHEENVREYKGKTYAFKNPSDVWRFPCVDNESEERIGHPTQKPLALMERIIQASSPPGGRVVDPFAGSGTTLVAAMKHARRSIGAEPESEYRTMARERFENTEVPA